MFEPFIKNHQYNFIKMQTSILQNAYRTVHDPKVIEAVRYSAESKIMELFPDIKDDQREILQKLSALKGAEDFQQYLSSLVPYLVEFPQVSEKQIKKLFPKNKKLKLPDLSAIDFHYLTYLGWIDISTNKWYLVSWMGGVIMGVEARFTPTNKKDICSLCNGFGEVALVSAICKSRPANSSPDYYKAVGNYMCINSHECNKNITDVMNLERFIQNVLG
jgi:hypothetical protein